MKILIVGNGRVGHALADNLSKEGNDVTIVDKNSEALKNSGDSLDVMCIKGHGAKMSILLEAGAETADILIAVTYSDEINMICCLMAKKLGTKYTIARVRNPEYSDEIDIVKKDLGIDTIINPEYTTAIEISRLLRYPSVMNTEHFADGRVEMIEFKIVAGMPITNMAIKDISTNISSKLLIGMVVRNSEVIIPNGDLIIQENDILYIIGKSTSIVDYRLLMGLPKEKKVRKVMIAGGSGTGYYLAKLLTKIGMSVKIIEKNRAKCIELSEQLSNVLIIHGDATDEELLDSENLKNMDVFVSLTQKDEDNLMTALIARQNGVKKVIPKTKRYNYVNLIHNMGIESAISPKNIITKHILKYVRGLSNAYGNKIEALFKVFNGKAEIVEFVANESTKIMNKQISKLNIEEDIIIAAIVRGKKIIIPNGADEIKLEDRVIINSKNINIYDLNDIVKPGGLKNELQNGIKKLGDFVNM